MANIVRTFIGQQTTSTGTGNIALSGSLSLHYAFSAVMSIGDTCEVIVRDDANGAWCRFIATYSATDTLTRTTFLESSTGTNISFVAGTKKVYMVAPITSGQAVGVNAASSGADVTLTAASVNTQRVTMTALYKFVNLPNATTVTAGWRWRIENMGANTFGVKDAGGTIRTFIGAGQVAELTAVDVTSAAGVWQVANLTPSGTTLPHFAVAGAEAQITGVGSTAFDICPLTSTTALICYWNGTPNLLARVVTESGGALNFGTAYTTAATTSTGGGGAVRVVALSSTLALLFWNPSNSTVKVIALSISGTTVTGGAETALPATMDAPFDACPLGTTSAVFTYVPNGTTRTDACVLTVSGTTITANTSATDLLGGVGSDGSGVSLAKLSSSAVIAVGVSTSTGCVAVWSVSGTTITGGTPVFAAIGAPYIKLGFGNVAAVSSTLAVATFGIYDGGTPGRYDRAVVRVDISGTTATPAPASRSNFSNGGDYQVSPHALPSSGRVLFSVPMYASNYRQELASLDIPSGNYRGSFYREAIFASPILTMYVRACALPSGKVIAAAHDDGSGADIWAVAVDVSQ